MINSAAAATTHDLRVSTVENVDCSMNFASRAACISSPARTYRKAPFAATRNEKTFRLAGSRLSIAHSRRAAKFNASAANSKFAQAFGASNANFGFKGGTRKEAIASVLIDSEVRTSVPQC
jgi:hypothetical protein